MPTVLTTPANDQSTYIVTCAFLDEDGNPVIPDSITWTLKDNLGTVINGRSAVVIAVPAESVDIVLSGNDIKYDDGMHRVLTVDAIYDSTLGDDLPLRDTASFLITDLSGLEAPTLDDQMAADLSVFFNLDEFSDTVSYTPIGGVARDITAIITRDEIFQEPYVRGPRLATAKLHVRKWEVSNPQFGDTYTFEGYTWEVDPNRGVIYENTNVFVIALERRME